MDDDLTEGRAGELIDYQADALPHRLNRTRHVRCQGGIRAFCLLPLTAGVCADTINPPLFSCRRSTPDSSELLPLYACCSHG